MTIQARRERQGMMKAARGKRRKNTFDEILDELVQRISCMLELDGEYERSEVEGRVRAEVNAMLKEGSIVDGFQSYDILRSRIEDSFQARGLNNDSIQSMKKKDLQKVKKRDEWYLVQQYDLEEENKTREALREEERRMRIASKQEHSELMQHLDMKKKEARKRKTEELKRIQLETEEWKQATLKEMSRKRREGEKLKNDQETQIQLLKEKKQVASLLKRMADDEEKKMIKIQEKELLEKIKKEKARAKEELDIVHKENQATQKKKMEVAEAEKQRDKQLLEEYSKMLAQQEEKRLEHLAKIQALQTAREVDAAVRGHVKQWIDPEIIEEQAREKEESDLRKAAEKQKKEQIAKEELKEALDTQVKAKKNQKKEIEATKKQDKVRALTFKAEAKRQAIETAKKAAKNCKVLKEGLNEQVKEKNKARIASIGMTEEEQQLNSRLLEKAIHMHRISTRSLQRCA